MRWLPIATTTLALCACWNSKDQYRRYQDEGHVRNVPLIIYDFTSNNPTNYAAAPLGFAFMNTQAAVIDSVDMELGTCNTMGQMDRTVKLTLGGPFEPGASFVIAPMGPADAKGHQEHVTIPHAVVMSLIVGDASGVRRFEGKQVTQLLDGKIANYCIGRAM